MTAAIPARLRLKPDRRGTARIPIDAVASRAYELYKQRGGEDGRALEDWFAAERELGLAGNDDGSTVRADR